MADSTLNEKSKALLEIYKKKKKRTQSEINAFIEFLIDMQPTPYPATKKDLKDLMSGKRG